MPAPVSPGRRCVHPDQAVRRTHRPAQAQHTCPRSHRQVRRVRDPPPAHAAGQPTQTHPNGAATLPHPPKRPNPPPSMSLTPRTCRPRFGGRASRRRLTFPRQPPPEPSALSHGMTCDKPRSAHPRGATRQWGRFLCLAWSEGWRDVADGRCWSTPRDPGGGVDLVAGAQRSGPLVHTWCGGRQVQVPVGLEGVRRAAQWCQVRRGGRPAVAPLQVAASGGLGAGGAHAVRVLGGYVRGDGCWWSVLGPPHVQDGAGERVGDDTSPRPVVGQGPGGDSSMVPAPRTWPGASVTPSREAAEMVTLTWTVPGGGNRHERRNNHQTTAVQHVTTPGPGDDVWMFCGTHKHANRPATRLCLRRGRETNG